MSTASNDAHEYTKEEIRTQFIQEVGVRTNYWIDKHKDNTMLTHKDLKESVEGAVFSVLTLIDSGDGILPHFALVPMGHPDEVKEAKAHGLDWYPVPPDEINNFDIAGGLHHLFNKINN